MLTPRDEWRLAGVNPRLVDVVSHASEHMPAGVSFFVTEGLRTIKRQRELVAAGKSQTMDSRHLTGHAVDLAVSIAGQAQWALQLYVDLAGVIGRSAVELQTPVVWGGCWCRVDGAGNLDDELAAYIKRRLAMGRRPFIDGPHFELPRDGAYA
jgi:peptidoglycan LD-endopeptidase CwlK